MSKVVGQVHIINGTVENITEFEVWTWGAGDLPVQRTMRSSPDCYGGLPHRFFVDQHGKFVEDVGLARVAHTQAELITKELDDLNKTKMHYEQKLSSVDQRIRVLNDLLENA